MKFNRYKYDSLEDYIDTLKEQLPNLQHQKNKLLFQYNQEKQINHKEEMTRLRKKLDIVELKLRVKTNIIVDYHMNQRKRAR